MSEEFKLIVETIHTRDGGRYYTGKAILFGKEFTVPGSISAERGFSDTVTYAFISGVKKALDAGIVERVKI